MTAADVRGYFTVKRTVTAFFSGVVIAATALAPLPRLTPLASSLSPATVSSASDFSLPLRTVSASIVAENPVAIVERKVPKKATAADAEAHLDVLYNEQGQEIAAKHGIRPRSEAVLAKRASAFIK
jgi:hypothetical protein